MKQYIAALVALTVTLVTGSAVADPSDNLRINGYGTIGYVMDNRNDLVAIRDVSQEPYKDYGRATWKRDSRLGIQAEYRLSPELDLVGQAILRDQITQNLNHSIELGYLGWRPTTRLDVRVGRVGYDAFLMSDTRNIGYAYPWVRPFTEYYGWIPIFSVDGLDAAYTLPDGDAQWRVKAQVGQSGIGIPIGSEALDFKADDLFSLTVNRREGSWLLKAGYSQFKSVHEVPQGDLTKLRDGLATIARSTASLAPAISAEAADLDKQLTFRNLRMSLVTLGAVYDDGRWLAQMELAHTTASHKVAPHGTMGYVALGRRLGNWTPFVAFSRTRPSNDLRRASADWSVIGQASTQATALSVLNSTRMDQSTWSLGTRWDFSDEAALKIQWDRTKVKPHGYGLLFRDAALGSQSAHMDQLTLTLDFVF